MTHYCSLRKRQIFTGRTINAHLNYRNTDESESYFFQELVSD